jgi:hypothetical protein
MVPSHGEVDGGDESHQLKPNFRTCGRSSSEGALRRGPSKDPRKGKPEGTMPTIPSKMETVLFSGNRERLGFGGQSLRFDHFGTEVPGPGQYKLPKDSLKEYTEKDSWGKCGTGGFASKSKRFARGATVIPKGPGPGQYTPVQKEGLGVKSVSKTGSTPAFVVPSSVNPQSFFEGPQPGPGHYNREEKWIGKQNPWKIGFTPGGERDALGGVPKDQLATPAPGEYRTRCAINTEHGSNKNAAFKKASSRKIVSVHPDMPIPESRTYLPEGATEFVRECTGAVQFVTPGPGEYNQSLQMQEQRDFCSLGSSAFVDSKLDRSSFISEKTKTGSGDIGPGRYNPPNAFWDNPCPTSMFKSGIDRMEEKGVPPAPGPCFYKPKLVDNTRSFHLNVKRRFV